MLKLRFAALAIVILAALGLRLPASPASAGSELVDINASVVYDIRPSDGPVHVSWDVTITNNDPSTAGGAAYNGFSLPVLRDAVNLSARTTAGDPLDVALAPPGEGPAVAATVTLADPLRYGQTVVLRLDYDLEEARYPSLFVTPYYVYLPVLAGGDQATVRVNTPDGADWETSVEAQDCEGEGGNFTCSGSTSSYVAAIAEVTRPGAITTIPSQATLGGAAVSITLTYFQGEDAFAQHLAQILSSALPAIEDAYGVPYSGPPVINVSERGRQDTLGYEGITQCDDAACDVSVSPVASDYTLLHEMAHLWSGIYGERWLSEGFAELISRRAADSLPAGLVQGSPAERTDNGVALALDDWADVGSLIGATGEQIAAEAAGYYRSFTFAGLLENRAGLQTLQQVNASIAASGSPADSRRFFDLLEDASGQDLTSLFADWVFPDTMSGTLADRRVARDRLAYVTARVAETDLSPRGLDGIRQVMQEWRFADALTGLDQAEADLLLFDGLKSDLVRLRNDAAEAGLTVPDDIERDLLDWQFGAAGSSITAGRDALDTYVKARDKVDASRDLWKSFGLLGKNPEASLGRAAEAFAAGDFEGASEHAKSAAGDIDGASDTALLRLLIVAAVLAAIAAVIFLAIWLSHLRSREYA